MKILGMIAAFVAGFFISANAHAACGSIKIAEMNWASAQLMANVDKIFLEKALEISDNIWSIHMAETKKFVEEFVELNSGKIISAYEFNFPLKKTMPFHTKDINNQKAILYHIASLR